MRADTKKKNEAKPMEWREAVEFGIQFARVENPLTLRAGDRLNLLDDLQKFFDLAGDGALARELDKAKDNPALLKPALDAVRELLAAAADRQRAQFEIKETLVFDGRMIGERERGVIFYDGTIRDAMLAFLAGDLADVEPWQIGRCGECRAIFFARRKGQKFCRHACANAAALRAYREHHGKKETARKARERYWRKKIGEGGTER